MPEAGTKGSTPSLRWRWSSTVPRSSVRVFTPSWTKGPRWIDGTKRLTLLSGTGVLLTDEGEEVGRATFEFL